MPILPIKPDCFNSIVGVVDALTIIQCYRILPSINKSVIRDEMIHKIQFHRRNQLNKQRNSIVDGLNTYHEEIHIFSGLPEDPVAYLADIIGFQDLTNLSNNNKLLKRIATVSQLVIFMLQEKAYPSSTLQGGISLNKAKFILGHLRQYQSLKELASNVYISKTSIETAWRLNKPAAHIQCAYTILPVELKSLTKSVSETLMAFLGCAYYIQEFLLSIRPPNSISPMIKAEEMWLIPKEFAFLAKGVVIDLPPYLPDIEKILKAYRHK